MGIDWADILAKEWMQLIRYVYKYKELPRNTIYYPIVEAQGRQFANGIDEVFGDPAFDTPDYVLREVLKQNTWDFSVAKNYNDVIAINNLLLDDDGKLRPWHDFKYRAKKIVGNSTRYLKTEHNTVVASAQMSRIYREIQRDKHIFPFVQFDVVLDGHTSDICHPLNNVIVSVDDPVLVYYFPPNHFNCRTTLRKLRRGVPTAKYNLPKIPDAFKNNPGVSGKVFTNENRYIANTPQKLLIANQKHLRRLKDKELREWAKKHIPEKGLVVQNNLFKTKEVRISRSNIKSLTSHFTNLDLKDMITNIEQILELCTFLESGNVDASKANYERKIRAGVTKYNYYQFVWKGQLFKINMEVINDVFEKPYAINLIKKK